MWTAPTRCHCLGSAPTATAANRGIEDRRVKLGCVMPGESPALFGDALRRLATAATYLYQDGARYWYSTQPTVTKLAEDRAEEFRRNPDAVSEEINRRLQTDLRQRGDFHRIHVLPQSGLMGAKVKVTLEIDAEVPSGVPDHVVRIVTENGRTLKFTSQGFELE